MNLRAFRIWAAIVAEVRRYWESLEPLIGWEDTLVPLVIASDSARLPRSQTIASDEQFTRRETQ